MEKDHSTLSRAHLNPPKVGLARNSGFRKFCCKSVQCILVWFSNQGAILAWRRVASSSERNRLRTMASGRQLQNCCERRHANTPLQLASVCWLARSAPPACGATGSTGTRGTCGKHRMGCRSKTVQAFAQTRDGYLWIALPEGCCASMGYTSLSSTGRTRRPFTRTACSASWFHGRDVVGRHRGGGIVSYAAGQFRTWVGLDGQSNDFVRVMVQDPDGTIWAGTDGGLLRLEGSRFVRVDGTAAFPGISIHSIYRDRAGHRWAGDRGWCGSTAKPLSAIRWAPKRARTR